VLLPADRALIDIWDAHGMPANSSTREHAVKILTRLVAEIDELHRVIEDLAVEDRDVPL
jgi:hypothetical protein